MRRDRRSRRALLAAAAGALLAGCGFQLRRPPPMAFQRVTLAGFAPRSPLAAELRSALQQQGLQVVDTPAQAELIVESVVDLRERSSVATTAAAQVRDLQLRLKFAFRARTPGGRELIPRADLLLARDLNYNETSALAKEQEEAELYREMQSDIVNQVLRRLASIKL